jgi:hypothetical protein
MLSTLLNRRGRREGRVPAAPTARARRKVCGARVNHRYRRRHPAFPARMVDGLYALSPVNQLLPPSSFAKPSASLELCACMGAPGPHDFAVRSTISLDIHRPEPAASEAPKKPLSTLHRLTTPPRPNAFRFTFRDVGDTPLRPKRNEGECTLDFVSGKRNYFSHGGLTGVRKFRSSGKSVASEGRFRTAMVAHPIAVTVHAIDSSRPARTN